MGFIKKIKRLFLNKIFLQKLFSYLFLIFLIYFLRDFWLIFFLTFIFSILFLSFGNFLKLKIDNFAEKYFKNKKYSQNIKKHVTKDVIIISLYLIFVSVLFFALGDILPQLIKELKTIPKYIPMFGDYVDVIVSKLDEIKNINTEIGGSIGEIFSKQDMDIIMDMITRLKTVGGLFLQIFLSIVLSYIFILDRNKLGDFLGKIENTNFGFLYKEYKIIITKISKTFGLVFKAQSMIALTNAFLTVLGLIIIATINSNGFAVFPFIYTLAIIVFICGFIPVIGTIISSLPILLIGYSTFGGITVIIEIVLLIAFIHVVEAYYLNPKIVSSFIKIPVSITFLILLLSEHYLGFVGLVIGISGFYLILELFKDIDEILNKSKEAIKEIDCTNEDTKQKLSEIRLSRKQ